MPIIFTGGTYSQNFDALATSGTSNTWTNEVTLPGWSLFRQPVPGTPITAYDAGTGSGTAGSFYSFGSTGSAERALGGLGSGGTYFGSPASGAIAGWIAFGATNTTGATLSSLNLSFSGEQWRNGGNTSAQTMVLQYGFGASFNSVTTWITPGGNFDWTSPVATATAATVDGNGAGLVANRGGTLNGISWANNDTLWLRWVETNDTGSDHGLAIDNFSLTTAPVVQQPGVTITQTSGNTSVVEGGATDTYAIALNTTPTGAVTVAITPDAQTEISTDGTNFSNSVTVNLNSTTPQTITVRAIDDSTVEAPTHTGTITHTITSSADPAYSGLTIPNLSVSITDNDVLATTRIRDIQGAAHRSPLVGQTVSGVAGIVTAVASNGFYFQDPNPDTDDRTSEGLFVFTSSAPTVVVGDSVQVSGTVTEFRPGNNADNLTITEITSPTITTLSRGNALPAATILGNGGRTIPTQVIDNDTTGNIETGATTFDPTQDGIDFYESLEGMRVQINNAVTTSPTNNFGEIWVLADNGDNATGRTSRGGIVVSPGDFNPERIQIDDELFTGNNPTVNVGAQLGPIVGVVSYNFNNYEVLPTVAPTVVAPSSLTREVTNLTGSATQLTVATFNVENLDPGDGAAKFNALAAAIVNNLKSPDIINLEEIQDNNGPTNDSVVDADVTLQTLINAIVAAGGPTYQFRQINPVDDTNGGEPGGNIRVGFLFNPNRVTFVDRSGGTSTSSTTVTDVGNNGTPDLSASPGLIAPTNAAFNASRKPLVGEFVFNGQTVYVIGNHFNSKGGDDPLFGPTQSPVLSSEVQRNQQATIVRNFVQSILAINPNANVIVAGDLNDFEFSNPLTILEGGGLNTLVETLPANERYTYNFQGNAQVLDHILVSNNLLSNLSGYDVVHINSEFADQISDHDPVVARFNIAVSNQAPTAVSLSNTVTTLVENTSTATRIKVADIGITDDGVGTNVLNLGGTDASFFEIDGNALYLKANTTLDFEAKTSYAVTVNVDDATVGGTPDASTNYTLTLQNQTVEGVDLSTYVRIGRYTLPEPTRTAAPTNSLLAQEVSAVTYNWDTDTLFVVGDGGRSIVQVSKTGQLINSMTLALGTSPQGTEFYDTEGLTYVGNGKFVLVEERDRQASLFTYTPGTTLNRSDVQTVDLGTNVGNIGLEGISYDPLTSGFIAVKENTPQGIFQTGIDFAAGTATNGSPTTINSTNLFDPALANLVDFADVFALSNLPSLTGTADYDNLLVLSQESGKIVNIDRTGAISSSLTILSDPGNPLSVVNQGFEGVTVDRNGLLYVTSEEGGGDINHPQLWVYAPNSFTYTNQAPVAVSLANITSSLSENTSTATRIKVGNVIISDDALGTNNLTLSGSDASAFEIAGTELFLRAGTTLDFETKTSYSVSVNVNDPTVGGNPDATTAFTLAVTDLSEAPSPLVISEVAPWSSGNSSVAADWFELTNTSSSAVNITGWKFDDDSNSFAAAVTLNGIASIAPGESVIFLESSATNQATVIANFKSVWFGANVPANLQFGTYTGSGIGLSTGGDAVNLFNATGTKITGVTFGASTAASPFRTFDNAAGLQNAAIATLSTIGGNGAFSVSDIVTTGTVQLIGSPSRTATLNQAPTAVVLSNVVNAIAENSSTTTRIKVADIAITDDALGTNVLSLSGANASAFELDGNALYLKANTSLDFETKSSYAVTVTVDDATVGSTPDASVNFTLAVTDVNEAPTAAVLTNTVTTLAENSAIGTGFKVADISITDDALGTNTLALTGNDAASFEIRGTALYYIGSSPNFEAKSSYSVNVVVDDTTLGSGAEFTLPFTLGITNINDTLPTFNPIGGADGTLNAVEAGAPITGTIDAAVTSVALTIAGATRTANINGTSWSYLLNSSDITALGQGANKTITAVATDALGNQTQATSALFAIDTIAPAKTVTIASMTKDSGTSITDFITNDGTAGRTYSGTLSAALIAASENLQVSVDGGATWGLATVNNRTWTFVDNTAKSSNWTILARVVDTAGNAALTTNRSVTLDQQTPAATSVILDLTAASDSGVSNTDNLTRVARPTFAIDFDSTRAQVGDTIQVLNSNNIVFGSVTLTAGQASAGTANVTLSTTTPLSSGLNTFAATYRNLAGNSITSASTLDVTYDNQISAARSITLDLLAASDSGVSTTDNITNVILPTFAVTFESTQTQVGDVIEVRRGSTVLGATTLLTAAQASASTVNVTLTALNNGANTLSAVHRDAAGNSVTGSATLVVTRDTTAPNPPIATGYTATSVNGTAAANAIVQFSTSASAPTTFVGSPATAGASGNFALDISSLAGSSGGTPYYLYAQDVAGNVSSASNQRLVVGTANNDSFTTVGGTGSDLLIGGGGGIDVAQYAVVSNAIALTGQISSANITNGSVNIRTANIDVLTGIEQLDFTGTGYTSMTINTPSPNQLQSALGNNSVAAFTGEYNALSGNFSFGSTNLNSVLMVFDTNPGTARNYEAVLLSGKTTLSGSISLTGGTVSLTNL